MNRKAYLKGLGLGIFVTCLILTISGKFNNKMSDEDIIRRAKELGYVESSALVSQVNKTDENALTDDTDDSNDDSIKDDVGENLNEEKEIIVEKEDNKEESKDEDAPETEEKNADSKEVEENDESNLQIETSQKKTEENETKDEKEDEQISEFVIVSINSGESSETVSLKVKEAGLVEDAKAFNSYLCQNGYDKVMRVGKHEISKGSSEEEIAKILSGKK